MKKYFEEPELNIIVFDFDILTDPIDSSPDEDNIEI